MTATTNDTQTVNDTRTVRDIGSGSIRFDWGKLNLCLPEPYAALIVAANA